MKWLWRVLGIIVVLAVLAAGALFLIPADRIASLATGRFEAATGRALAIEGDIRPSLWPVLGLSAGAVRIENADWAGPEPMFEAERVSVGVDPATLFGELRITGVEIERPIIRLATDEDGRSNLDFGASGTPGDGAGTETRLPSLDNARVRGGTLVFSSASGASIQFDDLDLDGVLPDAAGPLNVSLSGRSGTLDFTAEARVSRMAAFVNGDAVPVGATLTAGDAKGAFEGSAGVAPLALAGTLDLDASNPPELLGLLGLEAPDIPRGLGRDNVRMSSPVAFAGESLLLENIDATLDQNRVGGRIGFTLGGARPVLDAAISLGDFDLSSISTGGGTEADSAGATTGWSKSPIDMSALGLLDGRISVDASSLKLGTASIDGLSTETRIENARAVTEIARLLAYDGAASGALILNARDGFSTRLTVAGSAFAISRLLAELVDYDRIVAAGDLRLNVLGVGNTMDALMNSLDGDGSFRVGAGELLGLDIVGMLRNLDPSFVGQGQTTIFDEITGTFRIVDGVVINDDLRLTAPLFRATGAGQIGIGAQSLNLRFIPELLGGDNAGIRVPLLVTGTWDKPKVRLDLESALKSRVEEELRERVEREIGGSIEDRLEERLRKGLGDLLNR
ncbi:MAG: AsmA family protein [Paracoccaceae bacterium]|nr:AsmA family protein [Paracoccaceae bacterium]